jgi:hypothetical protein
MSSSPAMYPTVHQLRFVFRHSRPTLCFVPHVTSGDIARIWTEIADRHSEPPVTIDVTFAASQGAASGTGSAPMTWLPQHLAWGRDRDAEPAE